MKNLNKLIANHNILALEVYEQLNALKKIDKAFFSEKEKTELQTSILELETEYSMRRSFVAELESLS